MEKVVSKSKVYDLNNGYKYIGELILYFVYLNWLLLLVSRPGQVVR